jgi:hypothetical protein
VPPEAPRQTLLRVALDERAAELPLHAHDLETIALERALRAGRAQKLPLTQKPPENFLEGFYWERVWPARGGCGPRG